VTEAASARCRCRFRQAPTGSTGNVHVFSLACGTADAAGLRRGARQQPRPAHVLRWGGEPHRAATKDIRAYYRYRDRMNGQLQSGFLLFRGNARRGVTPRLYALTAHGKQSHGGDVCAPLDVAAGVPAAGYVNGGGPRSRLNANAKRVWNGHVAYLGAQLSRKVIIRQHQNEERQARHAQAAFHFSPHEEILHQRVYHSASMAMMTMSLGAACGVRPAAARGAARGGGKGLMARGNVAGAVAGRVALGAGAGVKRCRARAPPHGAGSGLGVRCSAAAEALSDAPMPELDLCQKASSYTKDLVGMGMKM